MAHLFFHTTLFKKNWLSKEVAEQCQTQGINNQQVLAAIETIDRSQFLPNELQSYANKNRPLPIGHEQIISQPYIVATMTQLLLDNHPSQTVLEIGTGSGYQAAILACCVKHVFSIERIHELYKQAQSRLHTMPLNNISLLFDDGNKGWEQHALFDGILITAATKTVSSELLNQLSPNGRLVPPPWELREKANDCAW